MPTVNGESPRAGPDALWARFAELHRWGVVPPERRIPFEALLTPMRSVMAAFMEKTTP